MSGTRKIRRVTLLSVLLTAAFGQTSQAPYAAYGDGTGPTFSSSQAGQSYPGSYSSIRQVNFRNLRIPVFDGAGKPAGSIAFKNGRYKSDDHVTQYSEEVDSIHYLSGSSSSEGGSALVLYSWAYVGGSSSQGGSAKVFTVTNGRLRSVQEIGWDTHFQAGQPTDSFDPGTRTLVIRSAHYIPGDAHCCVSAMDVVTFRWDGTRFIQTSIQTELSEYGKSVGKTLPRSP